LSKTFGNPKTVYYKKSDQNIGTSSPHKVTSWSEGSLHSSSIAGKTV
jgi:hypothetical protein